MGLTIQDGGTDNLNIIFGKMPSPSHQPDKRYVIQSVSSIGGIGGIQQSIRNLETRDKTDSAGAGGATAGGQGGTILEKDHVHLNKEKTRVQSILNMKKDNGQEKIEIYRNNQWTNPDDLTVNRVVICYFPRKKNVQISVE